MVLQVNNEADKVWFQNSRILRSLY